MSTGSTGPKRTPRQREADLELVSRWVLEGLGTIAITERLNALRNGDAARQDGIAYSLSHQQVGQDIKLLERRWKEHQMTNIDAARDRKRQELEHLKAVAWAEWHESRKEKTISTSEQIQSVPRPGATKEELAVLTGRQRARLTKEQRLGDARYLQTVFSCIDRLIKLDGLDRAESIDQMMRREAKRIAAEYGLSEAEVLRQAEAILRGDT